MLAQHLEQRPTRVGNVDGPAVNDEVEGGRTQLKLCPQPQVRVAFGLLMENPAPWRPSL